MKKLVLAFAVSCFFTSAAYAEIHTIGRGEHLRFDPSSYPADMKRNNEVFRLHCTKCHSEQRVVMAYLTGTLSYSRQPFDMDSLQRVIFSMYRKTSGNGALMIPRAHMKNISAYMKHLMMESSR
ncbi:hypothetical protein SAMN02745119_02915 [Trichlorobacter thiogenes]|uniref:Cytochrome c domain-containing protein n=1 Tax=Trichlorobacter thiogenes TaxID=115783 RepID=A0A1T4RJM2_9BACT|nr:hypothetical protein [Trichlorobacter thiogenes]SKA16194.1 hypothetical protein SAMN02745119_02915 [Trichlorobacter thiogenes]